MIGYDLYLGKTCLEQRLDPLGEEVDLLLQVLRESPPLAVPEAIEIAVFRPSCAPVPRSLP